MLDLTHFFIQLLDVALLALQLRFKLLPLLHECLSSCLMLLEQVFVLHFQFIERLLKNNELVFQEGVLASKPFDVVPRVLLRLGHQFLKLRAPILEFLHFLRQLFLVRNV